MDATVIEMILFKVATTLEPLKALAANDGRRRRLFKTRMRAITTGASKDVEETKELLKKVKERFYAIKRG